MNPKGGMDFTQWQNWLRGWMARHPVKEPPENLQRDYVHQVMARIPQPALSPAPRISLPWLSMPRITFGLGTAAACAAVTLFFLKASPNHIASQIERDALLLSQFGESVGLDDVDLERELEETDRIMLAKAASPQDDAVQLEEDLELLKLLESEESQDANSAWVDSVIDEDRAANMDRVTDAEFLEELKRYDQIQFEMNA